MPVAGAFVSSEFTAVICCSSVVQCKARPFIPLRKPCILQYVDVPFIFLSVAPDSQGRHLCLFFPCCLFFFTPSHPEAVISTPTQGSFSLLSQQPSSRPPISQLSLRLSHHFTLSIQIRFLELLCAVLHSPSIPLLLYYPAFFPFENIFQSWPHVRLFLSVVLNL